MSNIFEIDGEIEDNNNEHSENSDSNDESTSNDGDEVDGAEIIEDESELSESNNENDDSQMKNESDEDSQESATPTSENDAEESKSDEIPWYDRILSGTDEEETSPAIEIIESASEEVKTIETDENPIMDETPTFENKDDEELANNTSDNYTDSSEDDFDESTETNDYSFETTEVPMAVVAETPTAKATPEADREPTFDELFPPSKGSNASSMSYLFLGLFLITLSYAVYLQFFGNTHTAEPTEVNNSESDELNDKYKLALKEVEDLRAKIREISSKSTKYQDSMASGETTTQPAASSNTDADIFSNATVYQIQISAMLEFQPAFTQPMFKVYIDKEDGMTKMLVGAFTSESEAIQFVKNMRGTGFKDAFIVKKVDGKRVEYEPIL